MLLLLTQSVWHLVLVLQTRREEVWKPRSRPRRTNKKKTTTRRAGVVGEEPAEKQLRGFPRKAPLGGGISPDQSLLPASSRLLLLDSRVHIHSFTSVRTVFSFTQGLHGEDADPIDAAPVTIFPLLSSLSSPPGSYRDSWAVRGNVSPTFFIVIPRSGKKEID